MAHEIKNPLGSIMGSIEILESAVPEVDERREFVEILKKEIQRLSEIVSSHLDLVRSGTPQRELHDLRAIVESVAELTTKQAAKQGVRLEVDAAADLPHIMLDGQQVRQAVLNLVINAIQALPRGGQVRLIVERDVKHLRVVVEDDGPGLDEAMLRRAFEPFFTTKEGGTGLGLSIAFQIADQHGGDLRAKNRPAGGASVCLELPVRTAETVAGPSRGAREVSP
jgi:signal transduction histidine kinase